jgi:hypothetical protein
LKMAIEIVDFPIKNGDFPYSSYVGLPEGNPPFHQFPGSQSTSPEWATKTPSSCSSPPVGRGAKPAVSFWCFFGFQERLGPSHS